MSLSQWNLLALTRRLKQAFTWRLKNAVLGPCFFLYLLWLRVARLTIGRVKRPKGVVILPPSSPGSLGDEAVLNGLIGELNRRSSQPIILISYQDTDRWDHVVGNPTSINGGSGWRSRFRFARTVALCDQFYVLGTDVLDGFYSVSRSLHRLKLLKIAVRFGVKSAVVGFSFSENANSKTLKALKRLPHSVRLCVRDPISYNVLRQHIGDNLQLVADPAFLLKPCHDSNEVRTIVSWITDRQQEGKIVLGINANHLLLHTVPEMTENILVDTFVKLFSMLHKGNENLAFCLIPHDTRGDPNDKMIAEAIFNSLPPSVKRCTSMLHFPCAAAEVKAVAGKLDCVISGKMHLAIGCLGQGIPVGCITYKDKKFAGLFQHFNLKEVTIQPEVVKDPDELLQFVCSIIDRRESLGKQIASKLPDVRKLSLKNVM